jgi:tetratricopeptide (TPR) repeat protein
MLSAGYLYADPCGEGLKRVLEVSQEARETAEAAGDKIMIYLSYGVRAWNLSMGGRFEEAAAMMHKCQELAGKMGDQVLLMDMFTARRADIALGLGKVDEAITLAKQAIGIAQKMGGVWAEGHAHRTLGKALTVLEKPEWDRAEEQMARSLELLETSMNFMGVAHTQIAWGEVCRDRGDLDAAREHWEKAEAFFQSKGLTKRLEQLRNLM